MNLKYLKETREGVREWEEEKKHLHIYKKRADIPSNTSPQRQLLASSPGLRDTTSDVFFDHLPLREAKCQYLLGERL